MTTEELAEIRKHHDQLEQLEHNCRFEDADNYFRKHRLAFDYDYNGNWVGSVANENGWTP